MDMEQKTRIILAWELHEQGMSNTQIALRLQVNRETVNRWVAAIQEQGLLPFLNARCQGQSNPRPARQVPVSLKQKVWALREREHGCCGQKIAYFLEKEEGLTLSVPKIYEILAEKYVIRSKWKKNKPRGPVPQAAQARQVIQMDTIDLGRVFAFTAVDIFSREADLLVTPDLTSEQGSVFLRLCMARRFAPGFVQVVQTDGGPEFKGAFAQAVGEYCTWHRVARPYKKNEQAYIESFNRTVRNECLGWLKYQPDQVACLNRQGEVFLARYHFHRPHLGLDPLRPPLPIPGK